MRDVNQQLIAALDPDEVREWLNIGQAAAVGGRTAKGRMHGARSVTAFMRAEFYGTRSLDAALLSAPEDQHKLGLGTVPSYGLTLYHHRFKSAVTDTTYNLCSSAGHCVRSCVVGNSNGQYENVQRGWAWRTDLLLNFPWAFFTKLGWELQRAVMRHEHILMRPNVNSDLMWERLAPALVDGSVFANSVMFYGYSKHGYVLYDTPRNYRGDGWLTPLYRVAFSANEHCSLHNATATLAGFLDRGGSLAVVTDRYYTSRTRQPVNPIWPRSWTGDHEAVDADLTDEWIFKPGVIGDLAFKPRTTALRKWGYSDATTFVHNVYAGVPLALGVK
jgi:hypothetical protein